MEMNEERLYEMAGAGAAVLGVFGARQFIDPLEGASGFENWVPEFGALGRPSSVLTGLAGITAAGLALAADRGEGPTAGMSDAVNSGLAAFGGGALVASGASGAFTPEEQVKSAGLSLTTEAKLASRSLPAPERGPAQKKGRHSSTPIKQEEEEQEETGSFL